MEQLKVKTVHCITSYCRNIRSLRDFLSCVNFSLCRPIYANAIVQMHLSLLGAKSSRLIQWSHLSVMESQVNDISTVCSTIWLGWHHRQHTSSTSPLWVEYIQQFPHKGSVLEWRQISVMSNHRRLDYSFNSLSRLTIKDKSKHCISGSSWGKSGDRWNPLGKGRQFKKHLRAY